MILPSALRRIQETQPAGYVVAKVSAVTGKLGHLTNADLMDLDGAQHEAAAWRRGEIRDGISGSRYVVCAVIPVEQRRGEQA